MVAQNCPLCGYLSLTAMQGAYHFEPPAIIPGGTILVAEAEWLHCGYCGEDILSAALEASIDEERRRRLELLTAADIRNVREVLHLSVQDMSQLLGVGQQTYERWENGSSLPTATGNDLLRQLAMNPEMFPSLSSVRTTDQR